LPRLRRVLLHAAWVVPLVLALFVGWLWLRAGRDFRYMVRVLYHGESGTDDYTWKRGVTVPPTSPKPWPVGASGCGDLTRWLADGGALGFVVVRDGAIVCEWYGNGGARDKPAAAFSISKTVVSLLLARAVDDGKLAIDEPVTQHVPELAARDPRFAAITLAHLVDMRSGIAFEEETRFPWVDGDSPRVYYASDLAETVIARPRISSATGTFFYNDYAPNLVGLALERAVGARLTAGPLPALVAALGTEYPVAWSVDDRGFAWHESGLVITVRDLARVGQAILDDREHGWVARSLDPAGRARAVTFGKTDLGYRNGWWIMGDLLVAMGRYGQVMIVSPATRTVVVRLGKDGHDETNVSIATRLARVATAPSL
jgi:CubicO group peptidase (beta-lactamase class C family)